MIRKPGADYRLNAYGSKARSSGRTWQYVSSFKSYKKNTYDQPMRLLRAGNGDVYFVRAAYLKPMYHTMQLLASGNKNELWDLFLTYAKLMQGPAPDSAPLFP